MNERKPRCLENFLDKLITVFAISLLMPLIIQLNPDYRLYRLRIAQKEIDMLFSNAEVLRQIFLEVDHKEHITQSDLRTDQRAFAYH